MLFFSWSWPVAAQRVGCPTDAVGRSSGKGRCASAAVKRPAAVERHLQQGAAGEFEEGPFLLLVLGKKYLKKKSSEKEGGSVRGA